MLAKAFLEGFVERFAMVLNHIAWLGAYSFMGTMRAVVRI
jgi:hypothetical protein